jgi:hypothetical protein
VIRSVFGGGLFDPNRRAMLTGGAATVLLARKADQLTDARSGEDRCDLRGEVSAGDLCMNVSRQTTQRRNRLRYAYQVRIFEASGADALRDPPAHVAKKIQRFWLLNQSLSCSQLGFRGNQTAGGLLQLAVQFNAMEFMQDAMLDWRIWPNFPDRAGKTPLDFAESELALASGSPRQPVMGDYVKLLIQGGALRSSQLTPNTRPIDPFEAEVRPLLTSWDTACYFSEGLAAAKRGGLWGYVSAAGQEVIPPDWDGAFAFSNGLAAVQKRGRFGYIDSNGTVVIPPQFEDAGFFDRSGRATVVVAGSDKSINPRGEPVT